MSPSVSTCCARTSSRWQSAASAIVLVKPLARGSSVAQRCCRRCATASRTAGQSVRARRKCSRARVVRVRTRTHSRACGLQPSASAMRTAAPRVTHRGCTRHKLAALVRRESAVRSR
jgi:hypothetical protein